MRLNSLRGENTSILVEPMGFEPTTSSMPSRRAPNCATAPPKEWLEFIIAGERESPSSPYRFSNFVIPMREFCGYAAVDLREDRKSTRLNSSHGYISYAVFCL